MSKTNKVTTALIALFAGLNLALWVAKTAYIMEPIPVVPPAVDPNTVAKL